MSMESQLISCKQMNSTGSAYACGTDSSYLLITPANDTRSCVVCIDLRTDAFPVKGIVSVNICLQADFSIQAKLLVDTRSAFVFT